MSSWTDDGLVVHPLFNKQKGRTAKNCKAHRKRRKVDSRVVETESEESNETL